MTQPAPSHRVLPTLNQDGTRRLVRPKLYRGRYYAARFWVAWGLIALFVTLPFLRLAGKPLIMLDVPAREFVLFGTTFLPTDGVLLMLLMLTIFVGIFLITALWGRVWCGWGCPQTVYMEFVFRPIERWLEGSRGRQLELDRSGPNPKRILKWGIFALLSVLVGNVFLAYFVGTDRLGRWMTQSPLEHPVPFLIVAGTAALVYFDFAYFREQMCTITCPYARLQSVLLDRHSSIVGYDAQRGEPRGHGRARGGDCIDCKACVIACPTGIDIRNGLQLECIACAQCIDACDTVMDKIGKPRGLVRYASKQLFESGKLSSRIRPRILIYPALLVALLSGLWVFGREHTQPAEITVLRGIGAPFLEQEGRIQNQLRIKIRNRSSTTRSFTLTVNQAGDSRLITPENPVVLEPGAQATALAIVLSQPSLFQDGVREVLVEVGDEQGYTIAIPYKLLGPR